MTLFDEIFTDTAQLTGIVGVTVLLAAFGLNVAGRLSQRSPLYLWMNLVGAMFAAWYVWVEQLIPFVVLELVWAASAAIKLLLLAKEKPREKRGIP